MKFLAQLVIFSSLASCLFSAPADGDLDDGYFLFRKACSHYEALGVSPAMIDEIVTLIQDGGELTSDLAALLDSSSQAFNLMRMAAAAPIWKSLDRRQFDASTTFDYISPWRGINRLAAISALHSVWEGEGLEAIRLCAALNTVGMKVVRSGMPLHFISHVGNRRLHYPVIVGAIEALTEDELRDVLSVAIDDYNTIPHLSVSFVGDEYMKINEARNLFASLRSQADLLEAREAMLRQLPKLGVDEATVEKVRAGELLSVSQWEFRALTDLKEIQAFLRDSIDTWPTSQLDALNDEIERRVSATWPGEEVEDAVALWLHSLQKENTSGSFELEKLEAVHSLVGRAISHQYLEIAVNYVGRLIRFYRGYIASERLLLIAIASRMYILEHDAPLDSLQRLVDSNLLKKEMIIDPLTGEEFLLRRGDAFQVYSIGPNLKDEGGIPFDHRDGSGDIILSPAPER